MDCIFCKIVSGALPASKVYEDEHFLAFEDIHPKAPVHVLVVPKKHTPKLPDFPDNAEGQSALGALFATTNRVACDTLALDGYRLVVNVGERGGQVVFHVHVHIMAGFLH